MSSVVVAMLLLRAGIADGPLALAIPVVVLLFAAAGWEWHFSHRHLYREHNRPYAEGAALHERRMAVLTAVTVVSAASSVALSLIG
jgi:hypothetical protein